jgi:hypothetical protein
MVPCLSLVILEPGFTVQNEGVFVSALILSVCAGIEAWVSCNRGAFLLLHCFETDIPAVQSLGKFFFLSYMKIKAPSRQITKNIVDIRNI